MFKPQKVGERSYGSFAQ